MPFDDVTLNRAFAIFAEWGPNRRIPPKIRLAEAFPELDEAGMEALIGTLEKVSQTIWAVAELGAEPKLGRTKVVALLQAQYPFLKDQGLQRAIFLTNYYAWHEGYAK